MRRFIFATLIAGFLVGKVVAFAGGKKYGLEVGQKAPEIQTVDIHSDPLILSEMLKNGPVVIVFYRGGWCPYCNTQLRSIEKNLIPKLFASKTSLIAISVDVPDEGLQMKYKNSFSFRIISDASANILASYKVKYHVPGGIINKYKKNGIDIEKFSNKKHHFIAVPAVYVIDKKGTIKYAFIDEDLKKRAPEDEILQALGKY